MIKYPSVLPCFMRDGYELQTVSPLLRTEMSNGRAKQRRRYRSVPTYVSATTRPMTAGQAQIFETWWENELAGGSEWFEGPIKTPLGDEIRIMRFTDIYEGPILVGDNMWQFTFSLELRNRAIIPNGWQQDAPDFIINSDRFDILMNRTFHVA